MCQRMLLLERNLSQRAANEQTHGRVPCTSNESSFVEATAEVCSSYRGGGAFKFVAETWSNFLSIFAEMFFAFCRLEDLQIEQEMVKINFLK